MNAPKPTWLTEDCPTWCVREHEECDHPEDRYHQSEASIVPTIVATEPSIPVTASMEALHLLVRRGRYVGERLEWLAIEPLEQREPRLILSAESAVLLLRQIGRQVGEA